MPSDTVSTPADQERPPEDGPAAISDLHEAEGLWFAGHVLGYWVTKHICFFMNQIFRNEFCIKDPEYLYAHDWVMRHYVDWRIHRSSGPSVVDSSAHWSVTALPLQPSSASLRWPGGEPAVTRGKENPNQRSRCCTPQTRGGTKCGLGPSTIYIYIYIYRKAYHLINIDVSIIEHPKSIRINSIPIHLHKLIWMPTRKKCGDFE